MSTTKQEIRRAARPLEDSPWPQVRLAETDRLETFSDSVLSITITLLVAEIVRPEHASGQLLEKLAAQTGVFSDSPPPPKRVLHADDVMAAITKGFSASRPATGAARFALGSSVRTVEVQPQHHTRLPAYARGKTGVIQHVHGAHVFPDTNAQGLGESPQWLYTVAFDAKELWGETARAQHSVISVDAFEPYLEPA